MAQTPEGSTSPILKNSPETQISHKNIKIRKELNENRRNALKEYYKLKQQQKTLQKETEQLEKDPKESLDTGLENEILEDKPIKEVDLVTSDFKDIVINTNRLTSSINLINSSIKNIIYNNYYELIKLNQFLGNLNELDLSSTETSQDITNGVNLLDRLKISSDPPATKASKDTTEDDKLSPDNSLEKLTKLMDKIEQFDAKDYTQTTNKGVNEENVQILTNLLHLDTLKEAQDKPKLKEELNKVITQVKESKGSSILIDQLQELQNTISS